jgi:hypothetical protein
MCRFPAVGFTKSWRRQDARDGIKLSDSFQSLAGNARRDDAST